MANKEFKFSGEILSVNRTKKNAKVTILVPAGEATKIPTGEVVMNGQLSQTELFPEKE